MKTQLNSTARVVVVVACALLAGAPSGCIDFWPELGVNAGDKPHMEWNPIQGMHETPAIMDQERGMRSPPPGSVARAQRPLAVFGGAASDVDADAMLNPVVMTAESMRYGHDAYDATCNVCHGPEGRGRGSVVPSFPQPPDLTSGRARGFSDGHIYRIISHGQGQMWSYKSQLRPTERWAVVNHVRALQRAASPEPADLERLNEGK